MFYRASLIIHTEYKANITLVTIIREHAFFHLFPLVTFGGHFARHKMALEVALIGELSGAVRACIGRRVVPLVASIVSGVDKFKAKFTFLPSIHSSMFRNFVFVFSGVG